jgi:AAR2 protein
VLKKNFS